MTDQLYTNEEIQQQQPQAQPQPDLPAPGYARREELAKRTDALQQAAEEKSEEMQVESMDPSVFEPDREIQYDIERNYLELDLGPLYVVKWVNFVNQHGTAVWKAKAEGWQAVSPDMVKNLEPGLMREDNTLRVGDVVAMYIRKDRHFMLEQKATERRLRQQFGAEAELQELADKNPKALKVHNIQDSPHLDKITKRAAQKTAMRHLGNRMKKGSIPGVPIR